MLGNDTSILRSGYIDRTTGAVLKCDAALKAAENYAENERYC